MEHFDKEIQELKEGLKNKDWENVKEELGDILFNIFLFSKIAENNNKFNIFELFESTANKFIKSHKNIFEDKIIK